MKQKKHLIWIFSIIIALTLAVFAWVRAEDKSDTQLGGLQETAKIDSTSYFAPILTFHYIGTAPKGESKAGASLYVTSEKLETILQDLNKEGYQTVFPSDIAKYLAEGKKAPENFVALTFDDGYTNFYTNVLPLLKKYNAKASVYIMTGVRSERYLTAEQIKEIDQSGLVEVGSHTKYHINLATASSSEAMKELTESKLFLENILGKQIDTIAYPFGSYNQEVIEQVKAVGYQYAFTYNHKPMSSENIFAIGRVGVWSDMNVMKFLDGLKEVKQTNKIE
jgi:peptidoglycan/xylan/chitin deacetylase (PgdA/CDA1 family)